ncbi:MAG: carbohydrate ABC transporter permease [Lachnospiraceae bacterium]|nr:carbohydrate ABC transporter permease [Lachnospiraceae bacterium]
MTDEQEKKAKKVAGAEHAFFLFKKALIYISLVLLAVLCMVPFMITIVNSFRTGHDIMTSFTLIPGNAFEDNWKTLMENVPMFDGFKNSLIIAIPATVLSAYFSSLTAYALAIYKFKLNKPVFTVTLLFMMIPGQLSLIGFFQLVKQLDMVDTYWPLILPAIAAPGAVFFLRQYVLSILPRTLLEAARIDGGSELYIFHRIVLPLMGPGIATMAIGGFIGSWNNYLMPLIILPNKMDLWTLPLVMTRLKDSTDIAKNQGATYLGVSVSVVPIIIVFCFCSKYIIGSITAGGVKE